MAGFDWNGLLGGYNLPQFNKSISYLNGVNPAYQQSYGNLMVSLAKAGLNPVVVQGFRTPEEQQALYDSGRGVTRARGGQSFHNYGAAIDIVPASLLGQKGWAPDSPLWKQQGDIVAQFPEFRWGGNFNSIKDPSHVEVATTIAALQGREPTKGELLTAKTADAKENLVQPTVAGPGGAPSARPSGGNGMAGQGLLNISPEVTQGLLAPGSYSTGDAIGALAGGLSQALLAAGSGNPNWGAAGAVGFDRGMHVAQQRQRDRALQGLAQSNPQLAALFALGGPETVGKVLAAQMLPQHQDQMNIAGRVWDPNTNQFLTAAPAPEAPTAIRTLQALGVDPSGLTPDQKLQLGGIDPVKQPEIAQKLQALGIDPNGLTPDQRMQLAGIAPQKPEVRELNGRLVQVGPQGAQDITPAGMPPGARPMTADERAAYKVPDNVGAYVGADGKPGTLSGGGVTVNTQVGPNGEPLGSPGEGLVWQRDPVTGKPVMDARGAPVAIPFQGGKVYQAQQQAAQQQGIQDTTKQRSADVVQQDIDRALGLASGWTTGWKGNQLSGISGTSAHDLQSLLATIKANVGFDKLQAMREASPTGGALGQVSDSENKMLQSVLGNLEQSQSEPQFRDNLKRLKNIYLDIVHGPGNGPAREQLSFQQPNSGGLRPSAGVTPQAIGGMSMDDLSRLDPRNLSEDQRAAAERRWDELSGGANGGQ